MGELTPIQPEHLSDRELSMALLRGIYQTHGCLEKHIEEQSRVNAEQTLANITAAERRVTMAVDLADMKGDVRALSLALGVQKPVPGEGRPKGHALATWGPVKVMAALGGSIGGVAALYQFLHAIWPAVSAYLLSIKP